MKSLFTAPAVVVLTVMVFALSSFVIPETASAAWHDQSDELPGMGFPTGLVVAGAVVAVAGITYLIVKKSGHKEESEVDTSSTKATEADSQASADESEDIRAEASTGSRLEQSSKVGIFLDSDVLSKVRDYEDTRPSAVDGLTIHAGLTFSF